MAWFHKRGVGSKSAVEVWAKLEPAEAADKNIVVTDLLLPLSILMTCAVKQHKLNS